METAPSASLDMHGWPAFTARMRAAFPGSQRVDLSVANNTWAALWNLTLDIQAGTSAYFYDKIPEKRVCGAPLNDLLKRGGGKKAYGYYCDGVRMYYHEEIAATQSSARRDAPLATPDNSVCAFSRRLSHRLTLRTLHSVRHQRLAVGLLGLGHARVSAPSGW